MEQDILDHDKSGKIYSVPELYGPLGLAVYTTDADGNVTYYNEAAARLWGWHPPLGRQRWCGSWRLYWPDGRPMPFSVCPMAVALRERRAISGAEIIAGRPDGVRVLLLAFPSPLFDARGRLTGAVNTLVDITAKKQAEVHAQWLAGIIESSGDAVIGKDLDGTITSWNRSAGLLFGYKAEEIIGQPGRLLIPDDRANEEEEIEVRIERGESVEHFETVRVRKDGKRLDVSLSISPVRDIAGNIVGFSKIMRDITSRKRAEEQTALVAKEMAHRIRNLFSVATSVAALSAPFCRTPEEMAARMRERFAALSRVHEFTGPHSLPVLGSHDRALPLSRLAGAILSPYAGPHLGTDRSRVSFAGPEFLVAGPAAVSLALVLHEWATNAAKHGALSRPAGEVQLSWHLAEGAFACTWRELGGPLAAGPSRPGFGTMLARRIVEMLGGELSAVWRPEGVILSCSIPLENLEPSPRAPGGSTAAPGAEEPS